MYSCDAQLYFQHHYSSLQCHMILRNHNNMLIYDQETFLIIINVENSHAASYFCGNRDAFYFYKVQNNSIYLKYKSFKTL